VGILARRRDARPDRAFDVAFADLRDRFEEAAAGWAWFMRFTTSAQQYFDACIWEQQTA
jgi:hypothetical protein